MTAPTNAPAYLAAHARLTDLIELRDRVQAAIDAQAATVARARHHAALLPDAHTLAALDASAAAFADPIREWARANGWAPWLSARGPIPARVRAAYNAAHPQDPQ